MIHKLLVRQRTVLGQLVREPTLLALVLTALGLLLLLTVCAVAIYYVATCGFGWFAFVTVAVLLAALLVLPRLRRPVDAAPPTGRTRRAALSGSHSARATPGCSGSTRRKALAQGHRVPGCSVCKGRPSGRTEHNN